MSCTLYYYAGEWHVATKNTPDGREDIVSVLTTTDNRFYYKSKKLMYNAWQVSLASNLIDV